MDPGEPAPAARPSTTSTSSWPPTATTRSPPGCASRPVTGSAADGRCPAGSPSTASGPAPGGRRPPPGATGHRPGELPGRDGTRPHHHRHRGPPRDDQGLLVPGPDRAPPRDRRARHPRHPYRPRRHRPSPARAARTSSPWTATPSRWRCRDRRQGALAGERPDGHAVRGGSAKGLTLASGSHVVLSTPGATTGLDIDQLALDSAPGGGPATGAGAGRPLPWRRRSRGPHPRSGSTSSTATKIHLKVTGRHPAVLAGAGSEHQQGMEGHRRRQWTDPRAFHPHRRLRQRLAGAAHGGGHRGGDAAVDAAVEREHRTGGVGAGDNRLRGARSPPAPPAHDLEDMSWPARRRVRRR